MKVCSSLIQCRRNLALFELLGTGLVDKDEETCCMNIHRMTQELFREFLEARAPRHWEIFQVTAKLLLELFPKHEKGRSLRNQFSTCRMFVGHVSALADRCREFGFHKSQQADDSMHDFVRLAASCTW
jgi:hypothetical protein